ncbi:S-layer homology domain-containing protein [Paenibacillus guangzhouensis]|uniref:S-layer homology domain-containing protein n=1 Tax=Paenibacillus guangzhouensis TaxID=1473112 RepID=UPI001266B9AF|nr:S-layer homology domain-containing protein [Paenibacillus guangzhouensis]
MRKVMKKPLILLMLIAIFCMGISGSAFAHKGNNPSKQDGKDSLNAATAVTMIVKGLNLNIDNIKFIKKPEATDYYTKIKNDSSYADYFIIAQYNGLGIPKDINPSAKVTREQFAKWLFGALSHKGNYAWIEIFQNVADADQVTDGYMDSIQKLLIAKIVSLDSKQRFYPKSYITRAQAVDMISKTLKFINNTKSETPNSSVLDQVNITSVKETDSVTRVTLSAMVPHAGYGLEITSIQFSKGIATIQYKVIQPDPDKMYAQVITELKAVTYIPSEYKAVLGGVQQQ